MFFRNNRTRRLEEAVKALQDAVFGAAVVEPLVDWQVHPPQPDSNCDCVSCVWLEEFWKRKGEAQAVKNAVSGNYIPV